MPVWNKTPVTTTRWKVTTSMRARFSMSKTRKRKNVDVNSSLIQRILGKTVSTEPDPIATTNIAGPVQAPSSYIEISQEH